MRIWDDSDLPLYLLTKDEFDLLPDDCILESIDGTLHIKGEDNFYLDTRYGVLAYGSRDLKFLQDCLGIIP